MRRFLPGATSLKSWSSGRLENILLALSTTSRQELIATCTDNLWDVIDISLSLDSCPSLYHSGGQIWALPPSTNSSIPVTKLESSEARNNATFATSSGSPMRPMGMVDTIRSITSGDCRLASGVLIGPGLTTLERIRRSFRSVVQVRTKERIAALLAA